MYAGKNEIWISADRRSKIAYDPSDEKLKLTVNDVEVMSGHATDGMVLLGLDLTELGAINGALAGVAVASKAAVYDAQGKLFASSASPAAAGTTIADATAMTKQFNTVTGATGGAAGGAGVLLPVAAADEVVVVVNTDATNALKVYAVTGSQVNALGSTVAYLVTPGQTAIFVGRSAVLWYTAAATDTVTGLTAAAAELNYLDITTLGTGAASKAVVLDAGDDYRWPATGVLHAGVVTKAQGVPAAKTVTAGITAAELVAGLITTTGVTGPSVHQLPTGTEIDAVIPGVATGDSFDFTIINTGVGAADDATITANTDVTIVGNPTVGALTDTTIISGSGTFRARRSAANAYVVYRVA